MATSAVQKSTPQDILQELYSDLKAFGVSSQQRKELLKKVKLSQIPFTLHTVQPLFELGISSQYKGGGLIVGVCGDVPVRVYVVPEFKKYLKMASRGDKFTLNVRESEWDSLYQCFTFLSIDCQDESG